MNPSSRDNKNTGPDFSEVLGESTESMDMTNNNDDSSKRMSSSSTSRTSTGSAGGRPRLAKNKSGSRTLDKMSQSETAANTPTSQQLKQRMMATRGLVYSANYNSTASGTAAGTTRSPARARIRSQRSRGTPNRSTINSNHPTIDIGTGRRRATSTRSRSPTRGAASSISRTARPSKKSGGSNSRSAPSSNLNESERSLGVEEIEKGNPSQHHLQDSSSSNNNNSKNDGSMPELDVMMYTNSDGNMKYDNTSGEQRDSKLIYGHKSKQYLLASTTETESGNNSSSLRQASTSTFGSNYVNGRGSWMDSFQFSNFGRSRIGMINDPEMMMMEPNDNNNNNKGGKRNDSSRPRRSSLEMQLQHLAHRNGEVDASIHHHGKHSTGNVSVAGMETIGVDIDLETSDRSRRRTKRYSDPIKPNSGNLQAKKRWVCGLICLSLILLVVMIVVVALQSDKLFDTRSSAQAVIAANDHHPNNQAKDVASASPDSQEPTTTPSITPTEAPIVPEPNEAEGEADIATRPPKNQASEATNPPIATAEASSTATAIGSSDINLSNVPTTSRQDALQYWIVDQGLSTPSNDDPNSPTSLALEWLAVNDPSQLEIPGYNPENSATRLLSGDNGEIVTSIRLLLQRYGLAVLYFATTEAPPPTGTAVTRSSVTTADLVIEATEEERNNQKRLHHGWLTDKPECQWPGVTCDEASQLVVAINISYSLLDGTLPAEIFAGGAFPSLSTLDLSYNYLHGGMPATYDHHHHNPSKSSKLVPPLSIPLTELCLQSNQIHGWMNTLVILTDLKSLNLSFNQIGGKVPETISGLNKLSSLVLNDNKLHGNLPAHLEDLTNLETLLLTGNQFSGTIPSEWSSLKGLKSLSVGFNEDIQGEVPAFLGTDLQKLEILNLRETGLAGTIPRSLKHLTKLQELYLDGTHLQGNMPLGICQLRDPDGALTELTSNCAENGGSIHCDCCTACFWS